jgi:tRNA dimethylallyltransferase
MSLKNAVGSAIVLAGPTAIGKTAVAVCLAKAFPEQIEVVSADSIQVYRRFDIGSAKPDQADREAVPFHLVDVAEPDQDFSLVDYQKMASESIQSIVGRGKIPLVVGGTGLYIKSVTKGLGIPLAGPDEGIRAKYREIAIRDGAVCLHQLLVNVDVESARRIHANDNKRIIRALEVFELTGRPLSVWHNEDAQRQTLKPRKYFVLDRDRQQLYSAIDRRAEEIFANGIVGEVETLRSSGYSQDLKPMMSLGYLQANRVVDGLLDLNEAIELTKVATHQYARRQLIWFRGEPDTTWIDTENSSVTDIANKLAQAIGL